MFGQRELVLHVDGQRIGFDVARRIKLAGEIVGLAVANRGGKQRIEDGDRGHVG